LSEVNGPVAVTLPDMSVSLVYLLLRQVLQMLAQLACDDGAKDVELLVLRHQVAVPPSAGTPPPAPALRPRGAGGAVATTPPHTLVDLLRHPGYAAALASLAT
jgi:hypothetical protein